MPLSSFSKDKLVFDPTAMSDSDNVGAYIRSSDGSLITDHEIIEVEYASLVTQGLVLTSKLPGAIGNTYSFEVKDTGGTGPMTYTELAGAIVVDLVGTTPTTAQVVTLLAGSAYANVTAGIPAGNVIVAAVKSFANGENTSVHTHLDVYSATADGAGNPITSHSDNGSQALDVHVTNPIPVEVEIDGVYDVSTNPDPANVGLVGTTRTATPTDANQTLRLTGAGVGADSIDPANITALDVNSFGMMWDPTAIKWERIRGNTTDGLLVKFSNTSFSVTQGTTPWEVSGDVADGAADAGDPVKVGSRSEWGALNAIAANNDRADFISDKYRRVYVNNGSNIALLQSQKNASSAGAVAAPTTALAGRRNIIVQNLSNKEVYIGSGTVAANDGLVLAARASISLDIGQDVPLYILGSTVANQDVRVLELA